MPLDHALAPPELALEREDDEGRPNARHWIILVKPESDRGEANHPPRRSCFGASCWLAWSPSESKPTTYPNSTTLASSCHHRSRPPSHQIRRPPESRGKSTGVAPGTNDDYLGPGRSVTFTVAMVVTARPITSTNKAPLWRRPLLGAHSPPFQLPFLENVAVVLVQPSSKHRRRRRWKLLVVCCLAAATTVGLGGLVAGMLLVLEMDGWCWYEWCGYVESSTELWSYDRIDRVLRCDSQSIVHHAEDRARHLMDRAKRELLNRNGTVYGIIESPLLGFFIPKTGSNTQEYYHLTALAAIGQPSYTGCPGGERFLYECMPHDQHHIHQLCHAARGIGNHFHPDLLLDQLLNANCSQVHNEPTSENHTIYQRPYQNQDNDQKQFHRWSDPTTKVSHQDVLRDHSVCTIVFRDPMERLVSGFYEWQYQQTTPLTAMEYLELHGPHRFPPVEPMAHWVRSKPPERYPSAAALSDTATDMLEAVFESCLVGVTEQMHRYVTTLSRVLWIPPPPPPPPPLPPPEPNPSGNQSEAAHPAGTTSAAAAVVRARSRERPGLDESDAAELRQQLAPLFREEAALWHLARRVSHAQSQAAHFFLPLLPPHKAPLRPTRRGPFDFDCPAGCERCTPPGWERLRWTAYRSLVSAADAPAQYSGNGTRVDDDGCLWPGAWLRHSDGTEVRCCAHADGN